MSGESWRDRLAGTRMKVDREFSERVRESALNSQQWSLVMTAVEFTVEGEGETARLVADTSKVEHVVPEFDNLEGGMPGDPGGSGSASGGIFDSLKAAVGLGGQTQEQLDAATELAEEYAERLEATLEENGRWEEVREAARAAEE